MEVYKCSLSQEAILLAKTELQEPSTDQHRSNFINDLRSYFKQENPNVKLTKEDDKFILQFLRARKFDIPDSSALLLNYHEIREKWPELFVKIKNPQQLLSSLNIGPVCPLKQRSKDGCCIFSVQYGKDNSSLLDVIAIVYLTIEHLLESEENQVYGFVMLHDLSYVTVNFATQITPTLARKLFQILGHCLPVRMKHIIFTNPPAIFSGLLSLFTVFADEKMKKRILIVKEDYGPLYDLVCPAVLPPLYNGIGPELDFDHWKRIILSKEAN